MNGKDLPHVTHIITGLGDGGAEGVLYRLCTHDTSRGHSVISLMDEGKYGPLLQDAGIEVEYVRMKPGTLQLKGLHKLWRMLKHRKPDLVQTWMYHADLLGGVAARLAGVRRVFWGIRHTTLDPVKSKSSTILVARMCAGLSRIVPTSIVCCADEAAQVHRELGYAANKLRVVPNGYELTRFRPQPNAGYAVRRQCGVSETTPLIGMVARFDPQKDHENLVQALSLVKQRGFVFECVLIGRGMDDRNTDVVGWVHTHDLQDRLKLLGPRDDIPAVMNALDIHVLSSAYGEAFPNVLAEAMACGTPCVTTAVGDASLIVGETGWVVPPSEPEQLADAIVDALTQHKDRAAWEARRVACRQRIERKFSLESMVAGYHEVWTSGGGGQKTMVNN